MKRTLLLGLLVVSMSLSATAIYDPNNTVTSPDDKNQGDVKITQLNSTGEIPDYSLDFMQMDGRCGAQDADNASINPREVSRAKNTVVVEGVFQAPHPRHKLATNVEKTGDRYILQIKKVETSEVAPRCIGNINYHAHFSAPQNTTLAIQHNQTEITEKMIQETINKEQEQEPDTDPEKPQKPENPENETEKQSQGFLTGILNSAGDLF